MLGKNHPYTSYPAAKQPKHSKNAITDMRKKAVDLLIVQHFSSRNNAANLGSFSQVSGPVQSIIP